MRSVPIDINSIRFHTPEMAGELARIQRIKDYAARKQRKPREHHERNRIDGSLPVNTCGMASIVAFRASAVNYLHSDPKVRQEMTFPARQLAPGGQGPPLEIHLFGSGQAGVNSEDIQADIFDPIFAVPPEFGLRPLQNPAAAEIAAGIERMRIRRSARNQLRRAPVRPGPSYSPGSGWPIQATLPRTTFSRPPLPMRRGRLMACRGSGLSATT